MAEMPPLILLRHSLVGCFFVRFTSVCYFVINFSVGCQAFLTGAPDITQLPIGERRKLLELTKAENEELHAHNPKMPEMVVNMDSSAYINSLDFELGPFGYNLAYVGGMCAEVPDFDPRNPTPGQTGWGFDLPILNIRH